MTGAYEYNYFHLGIFFSIQDEVVDTNWSHTQDLISNAVGPLSRERRQKGC